MQIEPYLYFNGRCEEALEFYKSALGAKIVMMMRFNEAPQQDQAGCADGPTPPGENIMHASFRIGESTLMASDGMPQQESRFEGVSLSILVDSVDEAERVFQTLADGGNVQMPICETFFSPRFGMVADKFGVSWMVVTQSEQPTAQ